MHPVGLLLCCGTVVAFTACGSGGPPSTHKVLQGDDAPLRAAFNADSGKVRAIFLASPV